MTEPADMLDLPPPRRTARPRTRCAGCRRLVYVDRLVSGLGRCCAERAGLVVHRHRLSITAGQTGQTLFDQHLPEEPAVEPYPQIRIDVTDLPAEAAHTAVIDHARSMICASDGDDGSTPVEVIAAANAQWDGMLAILDRHAPAAAAEGWPWACVGGDHQFVRPWPCDDYRDACRGLVTGLPAAVR